MSVWTFEEYHAKNSHVYKKWVTIALRLIGSGRKASAKQIIENMRFTSNIEADDTYKLNNNATSYYVRIFEKDYPQYAGYFETRKQQ